MEIYGFVYVAKILSSIFLFTFVNNVIDFLHNRRELRNKNDYLFCVGSDESDELKYFLYEREWEKQIEVYGQYHSFPFLVFHSIECVIQIWHLEIGG